MSLSLPPSIKPWVLFGVSAVAAALYLLHDYKRKKEEEQIIEYEFAQLVSPDVYTQRSAITDILNKLSTNKDLQSLLWRKKGHSSDSDVAETNSQKLIKLITSSPDDETQFAAIDLVVLLSENGANLGKMRDSGLFQAVVAILSSPHPLSDEMLERILTAIRNCTKPRSRRFVHPLTGRLENLKPRDRNDDMYDKDDEWFSRELYQLHGLGLVVNKLSVGDEDIQVLALEIISNYCTLWKNKEEIGELGGVGLISNLLESATCMEVQLSALTALRHCIDSCMIVQILNRTPTTRTF